MPGATVYVVDRFGIWAHFFFPGWTLAPPWANVDGAEPGPVESASSTAEWTRAVPRTGVDYVAVLEPTSMRLDSTRRQARYAAASDGLRVVWVSDPDAPVTERYVIYEVLRE